ncbi:hypothetical protein OSCI_3820004 [Kamptonema sp. PCC 6506]|nr:hypothetical protein OSCI_3820004 [Kamptonema sp. PCC 6506]
MSRGDEGDEGDKSSPSSTFPILDRQFRWLPADSGRSASGGNGNFELSTAESRTARNTVICSKCNCLGN